MPAVNHKPADLNLSEQHKHFFQNMQKVAKNYFKARKYNVDKSHPYILESPEDWQKNIILSEVAEWIKLKEYKLHRWIHNGLSSQAMLFNLIGPLVVKNEYKSILNILDLDDVAKPEKGVIGIYEYENAAILNERKGQPTSIDFALLNKSAGSIFIEAKFTESEFGKCSKFKQCNCDKVNPMINDSKCYYYSQGMFYWPLLQEHNILNEEQKNAKLCPLADHYQFYRELLFAVEQQGYFVLIYDERNPYFVNQYKGEYEGIFTRLCSSLPEEICKRVSAISIQKLFNSIKTLHEQSVWTKEFAEKYGM